MGRAKLLSFLFGEMGQRKDLDVAAADDVRGAGALTVQEAESMKVEVTVHNPSHLKTEYSTSRRIVSQRSGESLRPGRSSRVPTSTARARKR